MKQFIVDRHTTPNTPTLEQVPTEKIPIYENRAAVEADLANLSVGQIVATADTGDELAQPVDVVEEDNLHAVTSNAVFLASSPNYANKQLIFDGLTHFVNSGYVVPDNGFLIASGWGTGQANSYVIFTINGVTVQNQGNADESVSAVMPVRKGDVVSINIYFASNNNGCYFVPCN
jgi:hypothetical protein